MNHMLNRKMPSKRTAWCFVILSSALSLLFALQISGPMIVLLAVTFAAVGLLSIPRMTYPRVLLLALAAGILPAVLGAVLTRSAASAIAGFAFAPAAALLVLTVRRRASRSAGILAVTAVLTLFFAAALLALLYQRTGALSVGVFKQLYSDFKVAFLEYFNEYFNTALAQNPALMEGLTLEEDVLSDLYDTFLAILPGLFLCIVWMIAWLSTVCLRWIFRGYVYGADRFAVWPVTASRPTAWVFLASILISVLPLSGNLLIIPLIATNFYLMLLPRFTIVGCRWIKEQFLRTPGCGCFPLVLVGFSVFLFPAPLIFLSAFGAFRTVAPKRIPTQAPPADPQTPTDDQGGNPR